MCFSDRLYCFDSVNPYGIKRNDCESQCVPYKLKANNMFHIRVLEFDPPFEPTERMRAFSNEAFAHGR
jgi:hypothetical protein